jgi:hypothetical protein
VKLLMRWCSCSVVPQEVVQQQQQHCLFQGSCLPQQLQELLVLVLQLVGLLTLPLRARLTLTAPVAF